MLDPDNLLSEVHRALKPRGSLILTFPNMKQPVSWLMQIAYDLPFMYSARNKSHHAKGNTIPIVKHMLVNFGFEAIHVRGTYVHPNKGRISQWFAKRAPRLAEKIISMSEKRERLRAFTTRE
jgi:SAM-dependent methyltransferase